MSFTLGNKRIDLVNKDGVFLGGKSEDQALAAQNKKKNNIPPGKSFAALIQTSLFS